MATREYDKALVDPRSVYVRPAQVLHDSQLDVEQKLAILRRWEFDSRELQVAEEEGMTDGEPDLLGEVLEAIEMLAPSRPAPHLAPTKQGGSH